MGELQDERDQTSCVPHGGQQYEVVVTSDGSKWKAQPTLDGGPVGPSFGLEIEDNLGLHLVRSVGQKVEHVDPVEVIVGSAMESVTGPSAMGR